MAIVGVFVLSLIINALAPTFGGEQNSAQALEGRGVLVHAGLDCGGPADRPAARHLCDLRRLLRPVSPVSRAPAADEVPGRQGGRLHRRGGRLRDRPVGGDHADRGNDCRRGHGRRRRARQHGVPAQLGRRAVRQGQPDGQAAGARQQARREQQEDGSRAEERRPEGAGGRGDGGSRHAVRRRQARRSDRHRSAQGVRARKLRRPAEEGQQRREDRHSPASMVSKAEATYSDGRARA